MIGYYLTIMLQKYLDHCQVNIRVDEWMIHLYTDFSVGYCVFPGYAFVIEKHGTRGLYLQTKGHV